MAEKWPEMVVKWAIVIVIRFDSEYISIPTLGLPALRWNTGSFTIFAENKFLAVASLTGHIVLYDYETFISVRYVHIDQRSLIKAQDEGSNFNPL